MWCEGWRVNIEALFRILVLAQLGVIVDVGTS